VSQTKPRAGAIPDAATLRSLIEQVPVTVYIDRLDDISSNVFMSPQMEAVLGYSAEEWASDPERFVKVVHPDDRERVLTEHRRTARTGDMFSMEYRMVARDGSVHWFLDEARVVRDETGQPMFHHGFLLDITARKELEEAVRQSEADLRRQKEYYESLLALSPTAIVTMDLEDRVTSWNPAAERLFGYTREEAIGRDVDDLVAASDEVREEARELDEQVAAGRDVRLSTRRTHKDGTLVDVDVRAAPVYVGGEVVAICALYHDISQLLEARRAAESATEAKSAFLATMSHEIRTPLNAVIGMTELLLTTELTREQRQFADVIRTSGDALLLIISDILDFSKIEAGKLELERRPFVVRDFVESALDIVAASAAAKGLELACLVDPDAPDAVVGDAGRLRQIVVNLLTNAVKFTDRGEVVLTVVAEPDHGLLFSVRDTGIGIPADRKDTLFESFTQVDASTTRRYGGTGLGLAISKRLTEVMGGRIWVESEVGKGSAFHFAVPVEPAPYRPTPPAGTDVLRGKRILVVDDNAANREVVKRHALSWGMTPQDTHSAHEALEWIRGGERYDIAVLDLQMPELDGAMLAREIEAELGKDTFPLLLLTSLGGGIGEHGSGAAFAGHVAKPIKASQLYDAFVGVLGTGTVAASDEEAPRLPSKEPPRSPLRVLVAEDNAINQRLALLLLERLGHSADVASNGLEAVESVRARPYDVVLMDVEMPDLDGLEATRRIRGELHGRQAPRIIAVTANAMQGDLDACLAAGMDDYLTKPIRLEALASALGRGKRRGENALDATALAQLRAVGGDEFAAELTETFLAETPSLIAALRRACSEADADELRRGAHTLKSHARTFGAAGLADACERLERLSAAGILEGVAELVDQIEREFGRAADALGPTGVDER
jgi:PAS domain S-box-containing protein